jgi:hypothetical protein
MGERSSRHTRLHDVKELVASIMADATDKEANSPGGTHAGEKSTRRPWPDWGKKGGQVRIEETFHCDYLTVNGALVSGVDDLHGVVS